MKIFVPLLVCGVLSQALAAPVKEEQKRQYRRLVKSPEDVENLEKELKAEKEHKKIDEQQESVQSSNSDAQDGNDKLVPPEISTDEDENITEQDPVATLSELTKNDKTVMNAVRELLDYLSEHPDILRRRMQKQQNKLLNELTESFIDDDNEVSQYLMDLGPQLSEQPKHVEKKNGYRVPQELDSGESEEDDASMSNAKPLFPGNYIDMQEGGEQEEKEEQTESDRMNKLAKDVAIAEQKNGNIFMHPVPIFNQLPDKEAHDENPSVPGDSAGDDAVNADSEESVSDSSQSNGKSGGSANNDDDSAETDSTETDADEADTDQEESNESQASEVADDDINEAGSDLNRLSDDQITRMLESELEDVDETELLTLLMNRHRQNDKP